MIKLAQEVRNLRVTVRPELVEGLNQSFLNHFKVALNYLVMPCSP